MRGNNYKDKGNHHQAKKKKVRKDPTPASAYGSAPAFKKNDNKRERERADDDDSDEDQSLGNTKRARDSKNNASGEGSSRGEQEIKRGREKGTDDEEGLNKRGRVESDNESGEENCDDSDSGGEDSGADGGEASDDEGMDKSNAETTKERVVGGGWRNPEKERMAPSAGADGGKKEYTCSFCSKTLPCAEFNAKKLNSVRRGWTSEDALRCKSCNFKLHEEQTLHEKQGGPLARAKSELMVSQKKRRGKGK